MPALNASSVLFPAVTDPHNRATQLAYSIYQLRANRSAGRYGSQAAKIVAIILPIFQVSLVRTKALQDNLVGFYFVANIISKPGPIPHRTLSPSLTLFTVGTSLAIGIVLLLAILAKYVSTQAEVSWHVQYADRSTAEENGLDANWQNESVATYSSSTGGAPLHQRSIYDSWLVVRFTLAFAGLA